MGLSCHHVFLQPLIACSAAFFHTIFPRDFATGLLNDPRPAFLHSVFLPYLLLCSSSFRANSILSPLLWLKLPFCLLDSQLTLPCQTRELFYCRLGGNRLLISTHTHPQLHRIVLPFAVLCGLPVYTHIHPLAEKWHRTAFARLLSEAGQQKYAGLGHEQVACIQIND